MFPLVTEPPVIQSVDRALRLLTIVATSADGLGAGEVAARAGINRSTAWKLLATLERHGLVDRDAGGRYIAGVGLVTLAAGATWTAVAQRARPILSWLSAATGETAVASVVTGAGITGVSQVDGPSALGVRWVGDPLPLTSTSPGKLLLAAMAPDALDAMLRQPITPMTARSVTDPAVIRRELEVVRRDGIATSIGDHELGVNGVSAPVLDDAGRLIAAVSVTGPDVRLGEARIAQVAPLVRDAAGRLQDALGRRSTTTEATVHATDEREVGR